MSALRFPRRSLPLAVRLAALYGLLVAATLVLVAGVTLAVARSHLERSLDGQLRSSAQSFRDGPVYTTTVFQKETTGGKLKAVHSRHELFDFALPGFTSSPEQYYGECEIKE